jgi:hypothetical protein
MDKDKDNNDNETKDSTCVGLCSGFQQQECRVPPQWTLPWNKNAWLPSGKRTATSVAHSTDQRLRQLVRCRAVRQPRLLTQVFGLGNAYSEPRRYYQIESSGPFYGCGRRFRINGNLHAASESFEQDSAVTGGRTARA